MSPLDKILLFLDEIGINFQLEPLAKDTFLPGLCLRNGALIIDTDQLTYPGDILHEAGHLACMPPDIRATMSDNLESNDMHAGGEMMAIAWSYAACKHIGFDPALVFHEHGYKGSARHLIESFDNNQCLGLPLLQWCGMSYDQATADRLGAEAFPAMVSWTCQQNRYTQPV